MTTKGVNIKLEVGKIKFIPVHNSTVPSGISKLMFVLISFVSFGSKDIPSGMVIDMELLYLGLVISGGFMSLFPSVYISLMVSESLGVFNC